MRDPADDGTTPDVGWFGLNRTHDIHASLTTKPFVGVFPLGSLAARFAMAYL